jgi:SAM-dependent MidA family methyltransferase
MTTTLPLPTAEAQAHSNKLCELIHQDIATSGGWIAFSRFMELALYAPGLGYYSAGARKFGADGDFVTAPEISPLFGRALARQVADIMLQSAPQLLELGAGSGKLAIDVLTELERMGCLPEHYKILEVSADLRERQRNLLQEYSPHLAARVEWLEALPDSISGAVIANEVLDALPVHLLYWPGNVAKNESVSAANEGEPGFFERGVASEGNSFVWQDRRPEDPALIEAAQTIRVPDHYLSEVSLAVRGLIGSLSERLHQGVLLFIDYGFGAKEYYHPQRNQGTLMCHYRHHAHDRPFFLPGLQDITAHVDFTSVAESAIDGGTQLLGYTSQANFLVNCGITDFLAQCDPVNLLNYLPLSAQLQKLTSPAEMGELFKVIAAGKLMREPLRGFARGDLSRLL